MNATPAIMAESGMFVFPCAIVILKQRADVSLHLIEFVGPRVAPPQRAAPTRLSAHIVKEAWVTESWAWRKSSFSDAGADNCVELARHIDRVMIRDSWYPHRAVLGFSRAPWKAFLDHTCHTSHPLVEDRP
ncbi:DUF397 domain-containing protein [Streptomyces sp. IB2014 016-6]|uniref:DUF397 domain-containing protein n=1 Tax=Streptomyces sp. IB2014 016-6 TaxID=2517818 RepID=UPI001F4FC7DF|nr:DUF397 domain-containing protein [Streptomyces sp. IB2014 016-6]